MFGLLVKGGTLVNHDGTGKADIGVRGERIVQIGDIDTKSAGEVIDATGQIASKPLGMALSQKKRTEADLQVFLGIHMDTVYRPEHPFQTTTRLDEKRLGCPGVLDAKGGYGVWLIASEAV